jgi:hypothetical protein
MLDNETPRPRWCAARGEECDSKARTSHSFRSTKRVDFEAINRAALLGDAR